MGRVELLLILLFLSFVLDRVLSTDDDSEKQHAECGIYLAKSTIKGAGLGMFAGNRDYKEEDIITDGDLMVPIFELDWHNGHLKYDVSAISLLHNPFIGEVRSKNSCAVSVGRVHLGFEYVLGHGRRD